MLRFIKFKNQTGFPDYWDASIEGDRFYRIVTNLSGIRILCICEGLEDNGVTPKVMKSIYRSLSLQKCKYFAQLHFDKINLTAEIVAQRRYTSIANARLPYKD